MVALTLVAAHLTVGTVRPGNAAAAARVGQGLLAWDGGWYRSIAAHGYAASGQESLRFFPAFPMAARVLGGIPGVGAGPALVVVANLASLVALALLAALVRDDLGDGAPGPAVGVAAGPGPGRLHPGAGVLRRPPPGRDHRRALGRPPPGLVVGRRRRPGRRADPPRRDAGGRARGPRGGPGRAGPSAGSRGTALLRLRGPGRIVGAGAAVVAPVVGAGAFLGWVGSAFGDAWLPLRIQEQGGHRGSLVVPFRAMAHDVASALGGHHVGSALHVPWVVLGVVLVVVAFRRLPCSYGALATAMLVVSLTSDNLDSFERYALGAFPLVVAASTLTGRRRVQIVVLVLSGAAMAAYAYGAFVNVIVP